MMEGDNLKYHDKLKILIDKYVNRVYDVSIKFPKEEMFGVTSQLRRSALSVMLNYVEGYARQRPAVYKNFLEISFGSLKESKYLLYFTMSRKYINKEQYHELLKLNEEIGAMLWGIISKM
jgi:four helix bundle protein